MLQLTIENTAPNKYSLANQSLRVVVPFLMISDEANQ